MNLALSNGYIFLLTLRYSTATGGTYSGQRNLTGFSNVAGTFTLAP